MPSPSPKLSLDVLQIQSPCDADWHAMTGSAAKRHCADCDLHVHDLAALPRRKAEKLLALSQTQRVCARVTRDADGQVLTRNRWRSARRRLMSATAAAAGFAFSVFGLIGCGERSAPEMTIGSIALPPPHTATDGQIHIAPAPVPGTIAPVPHVVPPEKCEHPETTGERVAPPNHPTPLRGRITAQTPTLPE